METLMKEYLESIGNLKIKEMKREEIKLSESKPKDSSGIMEKDGL